ncbi:GNAT family N-acetyltransferase [Halomonas sp. AOP27-A1-41]|uniref:GNAT family N-acetyltransferase n=1 Tax=Halomonas sp. AOP27-A1-41 TaxID=3457707 RepID=UPI0040348AF2
MLFAGCPVCSPVAKMLEAFGLKVHVAEELGLNFRGRRALCVALMEQGASQRHVSSFTLNVYESNTAAFRLYQALGFVEKGRGDSGALAMIKPITTQ